MTRKTLPVSEGVRKRLGRTVRDADSPIIMPMPKAAMERAIEKRRLYGIDDPENFTACVMAECLGTLAGAEALFMRRYAYVALPDEEYTRRYQMDAATVAAVHANDLEDWDAIPVNMAVTLLPPTPGRRLVAQGGERVSKKSRGILANPPRPHPDPYRGIYRNGVHANG